MCTWMMTAQMGGRTWLWFCTLVGLRCTLALPFLVCMRCSKMISTNFTPTQFQSVSTKGVHYGTLFVVALQSNLQCQFLAMECEPRIVEDAWELELDMQCGWIVFQGPVPTFYNRQGFSSRFVLLRQAHNGESLVVQNALASSNSVKMTHGTTLVPVNGNLEWIDHFNGYGGTISRSNAVRWGVISREGRKVDAVKDCRNTLSVGLATAVDIVTFCQEKM